MAAENEILFLPNKSIDKQKWDKCISETTNQLIYAYSFYLDNICPTWCAFIDADYRWMLPITWKQKFGIKYLYQPNLTQQLGVFYKKDVQVPSGEIINYIQTNFSYCEVNWNYATPIDTLPSTIQHSPATNFILDLHKSYNHIASNYHNDLKKNLKRAANYFINYQNEIHYKKAIELYIQHYSKRMMHVARKDYDAFSEISKYASQNNQLVVRKAIGKNEEILSVALLLKDNNRLYNLMNTTTAQGRKLHANHFLLDAIIREFSGSNLLFDFEGSDLEGVKTFYENFGSINQPYYKIKYNNLSWPLKLLKK